MPRCSTFCARFPLRHPIGLCLWLGLTAGVLTIPASPGSRASTGAGPRPDSLEDRLRAHVEVLSSDAFGGRGTGEPGIELAEDYIAAHFAAIGLAPLPGRTSFRIPYTLYDRDRVDPEATRLDLLQVDGASTPVSIGREFRVFGFSDAGHVEAEVVFAGYGITSEDHDFDEYAGLEVAGKIVLVLRHEPREDDPDSPFDGAESSTHALFTTKADNAREHGAVGMILVTDPLHHPESDDFRLSGSLALTPRDVDEDSDEGPAEGTPVATGTSDDADTPESPAPAPFLAVHASRDRVASWLETLGLDLAEMQRSIDETLRPQSRELPEVRARLVVARLETPREIVAHDMAGFLEGSDPGLKNEWVVIGAHHDHLGAFPGDGDTVYNGADDNASGTAGVLEIARHFATSAERPARSMVFVTFSGEERGLLGSRAMVEEELIPVERVRFMMNLDMIGRNPETLLALHGDGYAMGLREIVETANSSLDTPVDLEFSGFGYMGNSDHDPFFRRGIPFLFFFTGLHSDYHQLGDHADLLAYDRMSRIVRLGAEVTERIAERPASLSFVHWIPWLGASLAALPGDGGWNAVVTGVDEGSRAAESGLQKNDVVRTFGTVSLTAPDSLGPAIRRIEPGQIASVQIDRNGHMMSVEVERAKPGWMGIWPDGIDEDRRKALGLANGEGILVRQVVEGGPCDLAGLRAGDLVTRLDGYSVGPNDLSSRLAQFGAGETVDAAIVRDDTRLVVTITLGERPRRG